MSNETRNLMALRTEALRQFRIAFTANAPDEVVDALRQEVHSLTRKLNG